MRATNTPAPRPGSIRSLLGRLTDLFLVRAELFSIEAQEQKEALIGQLLLGLCAFCALLLAMMAGLLCLAVLLPPDERAWVLGSIAALALLCCLLLLWRLSARLRAQPTPFATTLREVGRDCRSLLGSQD